MHDLQFFLHHYKYCNNCAGYNSLETWRFIFCSENCKGIYQIASDFTNGKLTGSEAKEELKNFDLSDLEFYHSIIKQNITDILASEEIENVKNAVEEDDAVILPKQNETVALNEKKVEEKKVTVSYTTRNNSYQGKRKNK